MNKVQITRVPVHNVSCSFTYAKMVRCYSYSSGNEKVKDQRKRGA